MSDGLKVKILLADDHPTNRKVVELMLDGGLADLISVEDGAQALKAFREHPFDLILMDVQMPYMDGLETSRAIREGEALTNEHIPIIALTAHAMKGDRDKCLAAGMDAYLSKPVHPADLLNMVQIYGSKEYVDLGV